MNIPITAITVGLLALILAVLTVRVVNLRRSHGVLLGDGGNETLRRAIRGHANFTEYAPIGAVLVLVAELQSVNTVVLAVLAATLLAGRAMHGYAFAITSGNMALRVGGMQLTGIAIILLGATNLLMPVLGWR